MDTVIRGGMIATATSVFQADVGIEAGRIACLGPGLSGRREIDARGKVVTPGGVDVHVHLEYPVAGLRSADDFFTGTRAAALGGTTSVIDFVEARPGQALLDALAERRALAEARSVADYGFHMTLKPDDLDRLDQVEAVVAAGCPTFKHYMAYGFCLADGQLLQCFRALARAGGLAIVHAENWDVIQALIAERLAAGDVAPRWHPRCRPAAFEAQAAGRALDLAELAGVPLYIFHVSCGEVVDRILGARARGLDVHGETCPQYLWLDDGAFESMGPLPICSPPIREARQQARLRAHLLQGNLHVVSTDHCPFTREEKERAPDFSSVPGGVPGIQARMQLVGSLPGMSLSRWVDCCCTTPARLMGLEKKGRIEPGCDADLAVWEPEASTVLGKASLEEAVDWTPYEGLAVRGAPKWTLRRGEVLVEDGRFVGAPGTGRFQHRAL